MTKIRGVGKRVNVGWSRTSGKIRHWHGEAPEEPANRRERRIKAKMERSKKGYNAVPDMHHYGAKITGMKVAR